MALYINGVGQDTFNMNGVSIDNLYVDSVLVWSSGINITQASASSHRISVTLDGNVTEDPIISNWEFTMDGVLIVPTIAGRIDPRSYYFDFEADSIYEDTEILITLSVKENGVKPVTDFLAINYSSVPAPTLIPKYEMTEPLRNDGTFDYIDDSNNPHIDLDGKLTESNGTTPYLPSEVEYPENGTLALETDRIMDTRYTMPDQKSVYGIYGADGSTVYNIYALEPVSEGIVNIWEGDQDTPIVKTHSDIAMALPTESWKITDAKPDFIPGEVTYRPVYLSMRASAESIPEPDGIEINNINSRTSTDVWALVDIDNVASPITYKTNTIFESGGNGTVTGNDSGCVSDFELERNWFSSSNAQVQVTLPSGTFKITISANTVTATNKKANFTVDGVTKEIDGNPANTACAEWEVTSSGETYLIDIEPLVSNNSYLNSIRVEEV